MHDPDLLILDEPFSGLDPVNVELLKDLVLELKAAGKTSALKWPKFYSECNKRLKAQGA